MKTTKLQRPNPLNSTANRMSKSASLPKANQPVKQPRANFRKLQNRTRFRKALFGNEPVSQTIDTGIKNNSLYLFDKKHNMIKNAKKSLFSKHQSPVNKRQVVTRKTPVQINKQYNPNSLGEGRPAHPKHMKSYDYLLDNVDWLSMGLLDRNIDGYNDCLNGYYGLQNPYMPKKVGAR